MSRNGWKFSDALDMYEASGCAPGAAMALAEEMCGLDYGEGVYDLLEEAGEIPKRPKKRSGKARGYSGPLTEERKAAIVARRLAR